jgi:pyruvate ferredoxin oxidoreductase alpha subunit
MLLDAQADRLPPLSFLDLDRDLVARELERRQGRRPGPIAESLLRDLGTVASRIA